MSLSKIHSKEDNFRRDSFEDRVCDDLCEVILQFLPLKYKLKLECVSKQFQRTAFLSKSTLYLDKRQKILCNSKSFEQLLKKCTNFIQNRCNHRVFVNQKLMI